MNTPNKVATPIVRLHLPSRFCLQVRSAAKDIANLAHAIQGCHTFTWGHAIEVVFGSRCLINRAINRPLGIVRTGPCAGVNQREKASWTGLVNAHTR